ncbi:hypothetical protein JAAARDRAFT_480715 [Jaapia argillacea MUCL 33604]|uniref:Uncharacterized protein n=1 Tax=Jaapia argillacea MUCL 33604 TaxID=933084 RepID=A0A067PQK5_9AGAM|nr:hypothetical protein JAAARDRAFT_480715 [Jaapia argillacea MUCL 33604]
MYHRLGREVVCWFRQDLRPGRLSIFVSFTLLSTSYLMAAAWIPRNRAVTLSQPGKSQHWDIAAGVVQPRVARGCLLLSANVQLYHVLVVCSMSLVAVALIESALDQFLRLRPHSFLSCMCLESWLTGVSCCWRATFPCAVLARLRCEGTVGGMRERARRVIAVSYYAGNTQGFG